MSTSTFNTIELEYAEKGFATLWLNRPEKNNAFNAEMIRELVLAIDQVQANKNLRFLLLRGRGKHFCAGADLAWMQQSAQLDFNANLNDARELAELMYSLYHLKLPTLAVVQGAAFGGAVGLLRERDKLVATLQRLVMIILAVLAPALAVALVLFLLSLAETGLQKLWDSGFSTAAVMMAVAAFAVLLANAVIGNGGDDRATNPALRWAAPVLAVAVLPLAGIAYYSMHLRVIQYGWTPERIWGVIAALIALAYGIAGLWAVARGRRDFDDLLRPMQQKLAIGLALLALFLALPILDFGAISTRDQLARLKSGATPVEKFDWAAMAFDFGPSGRAALAEVARSPRKERADAAKTALAAKNRWDLSGPRGALLLKPLAERLRIIPEGRALPAEALDRISASYMCSRAKACVAVWLDDKRIGVLGQNEPGDALNFDFVTQNDAGQWVQGDWAKPVPAKRPAVDLSTARIEVETVTQRRVLVNGEPESGTFD